MKQGDDRVRHKQYEFIVLNLSLIIYAVYPKNILCLGSFGIYVYLNKLLVFKWNISLVNMCVFVPLCYKTNAIYYMKYEYFNNRWFFEELNNVKNFRPTCLLWEISHT